MKNSDNIVNYRSTSGEQHGGRNPELLLERCGQIASKHLAKLLHEVYEHVDDALFEMADKAENNTQQSYYFEAMREVRLKRKKAENRFTQEFVRQYQKSIAQLQQNKTTETSPSLGSLDDLQLVTDDSLEEKIAITNLVTKAHYRFSEHLGALAFRYAHLLGGIQLEKEDQPLTPRIVCETFAECAKEFDINIEAKLILFKLLDRHVMVNLESMYQEVNNYLVQQGIFPNYKINLRPSVSATTSTGRRPSQPDGINTPSDATHDSQGTEDLFSAMRALLPHARATGVMGSGQPCQGSAGIPQGGALQYLPEDVLGALSQLQLQAGSGEIVRDGGQLIATVTQTIQQQPGAVSTAALSPQDADVIDVVAMIFDYVFDDKQLPDRLKSIIARLQIPLIKVGILDKTFFSKKSHPARQLLNSFTQANIASDDEHILDKIESLVETLLNQFEDDVAIFTGIRQEFEAFIEQEQAVYVEKQQALIDAAEAQERISQAHTVVEMEVTKLAGDTPVPAIIQQLLNEAWKEQLVNIYLDEGPNGTGWLIALEITHDLLWSIAPKKSQQERQQLSKIIPRLLKMLRDNLQQIAWCDSKIDQLFADLEKYHLNAFRGQTQSEQPTEDVAITGEGDDSATPAETMVPTLQAEAILDELEEEEEIILDADGAHYRTKPDNNEVWRYNPEKSAWEKPTVTRIDFADPEHDEFDDDLSLGLNQPTEQQSDYYDDRVAELAVGDWVEFLDKYGKPQKAKLVWQGKSEDRMIFTDWRNNIIEECSHAGLASKLRRWDARLLENTPMLDKALGYVMQRLNKTAH